MNDKPITPHDALEVAESARAAASTLTPPSWYAPTALLLFTGGVALAGAASFTEGSLRTAGGIAGMALIVLWVVVSTAMLRRWRRRGFIPFAARPSALLAMSPRVRRLVVIPLIALSLAGVTAGLMGNSWALGVACLLSALTVLITGMRGTAG